MDYGALAIGAGMGVGAVVWFVRLEGRVNAHDTLFAEREKLTDTQHEDIKARLMRIEAKIDRSNGRHEA